MEYYCEPGFREAFIALIKVYYSPTAVFYHHYSLMNKFWEDMQDKRGYAERIFLHDKVFAFVFMDNKGQVGFANAYRRLNNIYRERHTGETKKAGSIKSYCY